MGRTGLTNERTPSHISFTRFHWLQSFCINTLSPDDLRHACTHTNKEGKKTQPQWRDAPGGQKYYTSYNIAPGSHTPVLVSKDQLSTKKGPQRTCEEKSSTESSWVIQPMHWGLVPHWHSGDPKSVAYNMSNARSDGMLEKKSFKTPLERGQRCVILCEGYFEWQTGKDGSKQPYYIRFPQKKSMEKSEIQAEETAATTPDDQESSDQKVLTMAGLYDIWQPKDGGAPLYSYSIITVDAHKKISWLHHRMPAILNGEKEVNEWLDSGTVPLSKAVKLIRSRDCIQQHPVSTVVNSSRNKTPDCIKPIDLEKQKRKAQASSNLMKAWLSKGTKRPSDKEEKDTPNKKPKHT